MDMSRSQLLATGLGAALAPNWAEPDRKRPGLGMVIHSHGIRQRYRPTPDAPDFNDPVVYLDHCAALGAAGVQTRIGVRDAPALAKLRSTAEKHRLYLEGTI